MRACVSLLSNTHERVVKSNRSSNVVHRSALLDTLDARHSAQEIGIWRVINANSHDGVCATTRPPHGHEGDVDVLLGQFARHVGNDTGLVILAD